ncbi:MAG: class I SAM-dependent methyltransferase [Candidatus Thorarchaeota archaeon]
MTALEEWQEHLAAYRREREQPEEQSWEQFSQWYDSWVFSNDYVERTLSRLQPHLGPTTRVLEIGPGSGAFTLVLAPIVKEIIAVEPAPSMRAILNRNLSANDVTNVEIIPGRIEDFLQDEEGTFDLALASYSLYDVESMDIVIRGLTRLSRHLFILMGTGEPLKWRQDLYRHFKGKDRLRPPQFGHFYPILLEMGIFADVEIIWVSANYVYNSEEELVEWWMKNLQLDGLSRDELREALLEIAEPREEQIGIYSRRRAALVWIDSERSVIRQK